MKKIFYSGVTTLISIFTLNSYANVVVIMNKNVVVDKLSKGDLQSYYTANGNRLPSNGPAIRLCKRKHEKLRGSFYELIGGKENEMEQQFVSNNTKYRSIGQIQKSVNEKKEVDDIIEAIKYVQINADGGICYVLDTELTKLDESQKKIFKVVYP